MAKGAYINDLDQIQIHLIYNKLKQMQKRVSAADVQAEAKRFIMGRQYSRSTVNSIITMETKVTDQFTLLDGIWSVGVNSNFDNPLPPAVLLMVLKIQHDIAGGKLTIREALWCAHLSSIYFFNPLTDSSEYIEKQSKDLWVVATIYALYARICDSLDLICDTGVFDDPNPVMLKTKVLVWFRGKITDELYQKLRGILETVGSLPDYV
jgi:hypothetical protein